MSKIVRMTTLINEEYFKAYSPIPNNYNIEELLPYFTVAEKLWVIPILGIPLYEELLDEVEKNEVTPENATLLLNLYPYLSYAICYEGLPFIAYHFSEVGATKGKSENSDSVSINDINYINSHIRNQVEVMKGQLKDFLNEHQSVYPLYKPEIDDCCSNFHHKYDPECFAQVYTPRRRPIDIR